MKRRRNDWAGGVTYPASGREHSHDLAGMDRDLRSISIEERCSFGAELHAELAAEYARIRTAGPPRSTSARKGLLAAAAVVVLFLGTWLVPPARASIAKLFRPPPEVEPVAADPVFAVLPLPMPEEVEEVPAPEAALPDPEPDPPPPPADEAPDMTPPPLPPTLPSLLDRDRARGIVTEEYPVALQSRGIGGVVRVLLWVRADGSPESPSVRVSSGIPELDEAALRATRAFRFAPATRAGQRVGTWVEFSVRFQPNAEGAQPDPKYQAFEIPLGNFQ